jgi:regulator of sigma E protease
MVIAIAILLLSFLVIIHEIGHFLAAKWAGVKVEEFGLGYPPRALKLFKKWGTEFSLNWIPFGGFVRMEGEEASWEEQAAQEKKPHSKKTTRKEIAFYEASIFKRLVIILAGATINFIFGVLAFTVVYSFTGIPTPWERPRIIGIQPNTPAAQAGVPRNVDIVAIQHGGTETAVDSHQQAIQVINQHRGETVTLVTTGECVLFECQASRQEFVVTVRSEQDTPQDEGAIGIMFQLAYPKFYPWYEMPLRGAVVGVMQAVGLGLYIAQMFFQMIVDGFRQGIVPTQLMSPVGIVDEIGRSGVVQEGVLAVFQLAGIISVNLAILNVMPIPALDGGRATFIVLSKIFNKRVVAKIEGYANYGGMVLLLILLLFLCARDVYRIILR